MVYHLYGCEIAYYVGKVSLCVCGVERIFDFLWSTIYMVVKPPVMLESLEIYC